MKFNFKYMLAGIALPISLGAATFSTLRSPVVAPSTLSNARPYVIEEIAPDGSTVKSYSGTSTATDPLVISGNFGANPYDEDRFTTFPDIKMGIGGKITLYRAPSYIVIDGKRQTTYRTWQTTVGDLLTEKKIEVGDDDKINFANSTELEPGMTIRIIRVALTNMRETQSVSYKITQKNDNTLDKGKTKIQQKGAAGVRTLTYLVRREDGVEISRTLTKNEITTVPVEEIQIIGTKPVITGWCKYNDLVLDASIKNGLDPDRLCDLMRKESNGNYDSVSGGGHLGLFQYTEGFWADVSAKAGYAGASWDNAKAQIYTTAWAVTHGYAGRWPGTFK